MNKLISALLVSIIFGLVGLTVYMNVAKEKAIDRSKIPQKVEQNRSFQKWITNLKNKKLKIEADEFKLLEENEIYNTKWMKVYSTDEDGRVVEFAKNIESHKNLDKVIFSPSERIYIDYRPVARDGFNTNEIHYYGQRDNKIIDARILDCSTRANCYFDRAYFLDNDVFVISEISRNIDKKDIETALCNVDGVCTYSFKIHVIDLVNNSRLIYESKPFDVVLSELIPEL